MRQTLWLFRESPESGNISQYGLPAFITFQASLISRIDCACYWQKAVFEAHDLFPEFAVKCRLTWSKNVHVEAASANYNWFTGSCILCSYWPSSVARELTPYVFTFLNDFSVPKVARKPRNLYSGSYGNYTKETHLSKKRTALLEVTVSASLCSHKLVGPVPTKMMLTTEVDGNKTAEFQRLIKTLSYHT